MTRGFHEPFPLPRSGRPSGRRGAGGRVADAVRSGILPATAAAGALCPDARRDSAVRSIAPATEALISPPRAGGIISLASLFEHHVRIERASVPPSPVAVQLEDGEMQMGR